MSYPTIINYNFGPKKKESSISSVKDRMFLNVFQSFMDKENFLIDKKIDWDNLEDIYTYQDIYNRKLNCDSCLKNFKMDDIIYQYRKLLNKKSC